MEIIMKYSILILVLFSSCNWFKQNIDERLMYAIKHRCGEEGIYDKPLRCVNNYNNTLKLESLVLNTCQIKSLKGLNSENFPNLTSLTVKYNYIVSIHELPDNLIELDLSGNDLIQLPAKLPSNLEVLGLWKNELTYLPELPNSLKFLNIDYNNITNIPKLPSNLRYLSCIDNFNIVLPETLPVNLQHLGINRNLITEEQIAKYKQQCPKLEIFLY